MVTACSAFRLCSCAYVLLRVAHSCQLHCLEVLDCLDDMAGDSSSSFAVVMAAGWGSSCLDRTSCCFVHSPRHDPWHLPGDSSSCRVGALTMANFISSGLLL